MANELGKPEGCDWKDLGSFSQEKIERYERLLAQMYSFFDGCYYLGTARSDIECETASPDIFEKAWEVSATAIKKECPEEVSAVFDFFLKKHGGGIKHLRSKHEKEMGSFIAYMEATIEEIKKDFPEKKEKLNFALEKVEGLKNKNIHTAAMGCFLQIFTDIYATVLDVLDICLCQYDLLVYCQKSRKISFEKSSWVPNPEVLKELQDAGIPFVTPRDLIGD